MRMPEPPEVPKTGCKCPLCTAIIQDVLEKNSRSTRLATEERLFPGRNVNTRMMTERG